MRINRFDVGSCQMFRLQRIGFNPLFVQADDFKHPCCRDSDDICCNHFIGRVGELFLENIGLEMIIRPIFCFQYDFSRGQLLLYLGIGIYFVVDAALKLGALPCQFLRIHGNILKTCGLCSDRYEVRHPRSTAKLSSARTDPTDTSGFLSCADLLHFDTHMKVFGQDLNQLPEINSSFGNIIKDRLISIALIFDIANFHRQAEIGSDLP